MTKTKQEMKLSRVNRLKQNPTLAPHASASTYTNWGCRCQPCRKAHSTATAILKVKRAQRLAANPAIVQHGKASTYFNWGCRCQPCRKARSIEGEKRRGAAA